jgi:hypothetical protein
MKFTYIYLLLSLLLISCNNQKLQQETNQETQGSKSEKVVQALSESSDGLIGVWRQHYGDSWVDWELSKAAPVYIMFMTRSEGGTLSIPLLRSNDDRGVIFKDAGEMVFEDGEYWIIDDQGNLEFWGPPEPEYGMNGFFDEFPPK